MADSDSTVAPGVTRDDYWFGYYLFGSRQALISAGLVQADWLADGTERNKRGQAVRSKRLIVDGRHINTTMTNPKRELFRVQINYPEHEREARRRVEEAAHAAAEVRRKLDAMPKSAEAYRKRIVEDIAHFTGVAIGLASTSSFDGYRLHSETIAELQRLASHMENVIETADVIFDRRARDVAELKIRAEAAKTDPALQNFMQRITSTQAAD